MGLAPRPDLATLRRASSTNDSQAKGREYRSEAERNDTRMENQLFLQCLKLILKERKKDGVEDSNVRTPAQFTDDRAILAIKPISIAGG